MSQSGLSFVLLCNVTCNDNIKPRTICLWADAELNCLLAILGKASAAIHCAWNMEKKNTSDTEKCSVIAIKLEFQVLAASAPENQVTSMHVVATATAGRLVMSGETNLIWKLKDLTWESNLICLQYKWSSLLSQIRTIFPFSHSSWWSGEFLSSCFISKGLDSDVRAFQLGWNIAVCKD